MARAESPPNATVTLPPELWTIGHSTQPVEAFIEALRRNRIERIADVRRFPASRRHPQFDADALEASLGDAGIGYAPFVDLGGRRRARRDSRNTAWTNASFRGYADYMETPEYAAAIERLCGYAARRCAVMCAESLWWRCHRALISDLFKSRGTTVWHIAPGGAVSEHPYTSAARLDADGSLDYGAAQAALFARGN